MTSYTPEKMAFPKNYNSSYGQCTKKPQPKGTLSSQSPQFSSRRVVKTVGYTRLLAYFFILVGGDEGAEAETVLPFPHRTNTLLMSLLTLLCELYFINICTTLPGITPHYLFPVLYREGNSVGNIFISHIHAGSKIV